MRKTLLGVLLLSLTLLHDVKELRKNRFNLRQNQLLLPNSPLLHIATEIIIETDYCFERHTNKEKLIGAAKPEEVVDSEFSGAG